MVFGIFGDVMIFGFPGFFFRGCLDVLGDLVLRLLFIVLDDMGFCDENWLGVWAWIYFGWFWGWVDFVGG